MILVPLLSSAIYCVLSVFGEKSEQYKLGEKSRTPQQYRGERDRDLLPFPFKDIWRVTKEVLLLWLFVDCEKKKERKKKKADPQLMKRKFKHQNGNEPNYSPWVSQLLYI